MLVSLTCSTALHALPQSRLPAIPRQAASGQQKYSPSQGPIEIIEAAALYRQFKAKTYCTKQGLRKYGLSCQQNGFRRATLHYSILRQQPVARSMSLQTFTQIAFLHQAALTLATLRTKNHLRTAAFCTNLFSSYKNPKTSRPCLRHVHPST